MNHQSNREWVAFRYLAEELSPTERIEFENELETSESACDELVNSVRFTQSLSSALRQSDKVLANRTIERKSAIRNLAFVRNCVCLLLFVAVSLGLGYSLGIWDRDPTVENRIADNSSKDIVSTDLTQANELIALWVDIESASLDDFAMDDVLFEENTDEGDLGTGEEMEDDSFDWLHWAFRN